MPQRLTQRLKHIPIIGPVFSFPWEVIRKSFSQLFFLWVLSSMPVLFSVMSEMIDGEALSVALAKMVNIKIIFIYTAAFLAPLLYMGINRLVYSRKEKIFHGADFIVLIAIIILVFSAWAYGDSRFNEDSWAEYGYSIYGLSLYFWFLAIADDRYAGKDYVSIVNNDTDDFVEATRGN